MFEFDVGTHYVGECGPGGWMHRALRADLTERIQSLRHRPEGHCQIMIPGTTFQTPAEERQLVEPSTDLLGVPGGVAAVRRAGVGQPRVGPG